MSSVAMPFAEQGLLLLATDGLDPTRTQTFQYDSLNRLTQAVSAAYGVSNTITYSY